MAVAGAGAEIMDKVGSGAEIMDKVGARAENKQLQIRKTVSMFKKGITKTIQGALTQLKTCSFVYTCMLT